MVKLALPEVPPLMQATARSVGGFIVILIASYLRGIPLFRRDGTLSAGLLMGTVFALEFVLIFFGLLYTTASRAVIFLYTAPFFVAFGAVNLLGEKLRRRPMGGPCAGLCRHRHRHRRAAGRRRFDTCCSATCC